MLRGIGLLQLENLDVPHLYTPQDNEAPFEAVSVRLRGVICVCTKF